LVLHVEDADLDRRFSICSSWSNSSGKTSVIVHDPFVREPTDQRPDDKTLLQKSAWTADLFCFRETGRLNRCSPGDAQTRFRGGANPARSVWPPTMRRRRPITVAPEPWRRPGSDNNGSLRSMWLPRQLGWVAQRLGTAGGRTTGSEIDGTPMPWGPGQNSNAQGADPSGIQTSSKDGERPPSPQNKPGRDHEMEKSVLS
jgi:hypothetical protein